MNDTELCCLPASQAVRLFKAKTLSSVELMEATVRRAEVTKKKINCLTYTHFDEAMDLPRKAEAKYAKGARTGAPAGSQIVGRTYYNADVFQAAMAYETAQGQWFRDPQTRPKL